MVETHRPDDVGVKVDHLAARRDQRHDDDKRDQGKDEREFDHSLAGLQGEPRLQQPTLYRQRVVVMFENRLMS